MSRNSGCPWARGASCWQRWVLCRLDTVPSPRDEAERRQLTVMFVDLADSTALAIRLDPEAMRDILRGYQNTVAGEITRVGGHVAKLMGDGVLAYFGWPRAHEDDAERAARAGLAAAEAVNRMTTAAGERLAARVGIATGLVVVGDLVGEGSAQEHAVVGTTPNLAARLQAEAGRGEVVIAEGTRRLLGAGFVVDAGWPTRAEGPRRAAPFIPCRPGRGTRAPFRRDSIRTDGRSRGRIDGAAQGLAAGDDRQRPNRAAQRRSGDRQIPIAALSGAGNC